MIKYSASVQGVIILAFYWESGWKYLSLSSPSCSMMDGKKNMADTERFLLILVSSYFLFSKITISKVAKLRVGEMNSMKFNHGNWRFVGVRSWPHGRFGDCFRLINVKKGASSSHRAQLYMGLLGMIFTIHGKKKKEKKKLLSCFSSCTC